MKARVLAAAILALVSVGGLAAPSGAKAPTRGCPPAFTGPLTVEQVIEMFPPPPQVTDPEGAIASFDSNTDGSVCVLPLPNGRINVVDNVARA